MNDSQGSPIKMDSPHSARKSEEKHGHGWCIGIKETFANEIIIQLKLAFARYEVWE